MLRHNTKELHQFFFATEALYHIYITTFLCVSEHSVLLTKYIWLCQMTCILRLNMK